MGDFTHSDNFNPKSGFLTVVWGANVPVVEGELNEAQLIQEEHRKRLVQALVGVGGGTTAEGSSVGSHTFSEGVYSIDDAYIFLPSGSIVFVDHAEIPLLANQAVYLVAHYTVASKDTPLTEYGYVDGNYMENGIQDARLGETETTRRRQVEYTLATQGTIGEGYEFVLLGEVDGVGNFSNSAPIVWTLPKLYELVNTLTSGTEGGLLEHKTSGDHDGRYYTKGEVDTFQANQNTNVDTRFTNHFLASSVDHDGRYFTKSAVDAKIDNLSGLLTSHKSSYDHNGAYYTELEVNTMFGNHKKADCIDHDNRYYTEAEIQTNYVPMSHKASADHDARYYTKTEVDAQWTTHKDANTTHHDNRYYYKTQIDGFLATRDTNLTTHKTSTDHDARYLTLTAFATHHAAGSTDHDDRYYTETEADAKFALATHVGATGAAHGVATSSVAGFMSSTDKGRLDRIAAIYQHYYRFTPNLTQPSDFDASALVGGYWSSRGEIMMNETAGFSHMFVMDVTITGTPTITFNVDDRDDAVYFWRTNTDGTNPIQIGSLTGNVTEAASVTWTPTAGDHRLVIITNDNGAGVTILKLRRFLHQTGIVFKSTPNF